MAINGSPRKTIPLNFGDDNNSRPRTINLSSGPAITKRAFFCGVVVEGPNDGEDLSDDVQELVASLGDRLITNFESINSSQSISLSPANSLNSKNQGVSNASAFNNFLDELVSSEGNYVKRLRILKKSYADPLRSYARNKETAIIPGYVANTLFANIDQILPANEAFLQDLQQMMTSDGPGTVGGVGDVALHHFKTLNAFECYKKYYVKREEAQMLCKQEMSKKSSTGLAVLEQRVQSATDDPKDRVGLRELMMEPVQRIPRYTLFFRSMMKVMDPRDPQRAKLAEADGIASKIALAESDDHTRLAATLNYLGSSIEGFPPELIRSTRRFIDCIDVEDNIADGLGMGAGSNPYASISSSSASVNSGSGGTLNCTLFLFDDKLMIVRRPNAEKPGRVLAGLDDVEKFANGGFHLKSFMKKNTMTCKGVLDVCDVVATDVSGPDMHFFFESPPFEQGERWSGRPLRVYSVVHPPVAVNQDPIRTSTDKRRFLENLWRVQARFRTKKGQSVALQGEELEVENRGGRLTVARPYFNVYQRTQFLSEENKTKIVLHIDSLGNADPLPFVMGEPPIVVVRVHPMEGVSKYTVTSNNPDDEDDEVVIQTDEVPQKITHTIHQYGLFKFRTNIISRPATPTSSRSRAHLFDLNAISRNLLGALPGGKSERDVFANGSIGSHRRTKSAMPAISRSSTTTTTSSATGDSMMKFSSRSTSTAATSLSFRSSIIEDDSFGDRAKSNSNGSPTPKRKLVKRNRSRSRSPGVALGEERSYDEDSLQRNPSIKRSRSNSTTAMDYNNYDNYDNYDGTDFKSKRVVSQSERDLFNQLELARRNSRNQHNREVPRGTMDVPIEETIYEEEPPLPARPLSRASRSTATHERDGFSLRSTTPPTTRSITPTPRSTSPIKGGPRSPSLHSFERRPMGPRPVSPLPPLSPSMQVTSIQSLSANSPMDIEKALDATLAGLERRPRTPSRHSNEQHHQADPPSPSPLPRSKRQPFNPTGNTDATPKRNNSKAIEPLSIKKKTSNAGASPTKEQPRTPSSIRRPQVKDSPLSRISTFKLASTVASPSRKDSPQPTGISEEVRSRLMAIAETTKADVESSQRAVKRIRLELKSVPTSMRPSQSSSSDNVRLSRATPITPTRAAAASEAQARMEEMRQLIKQRSGVAGARDKFKSGLEATSSCSSIDVASSNADTQAWLGTIEDSASTAEADLGRALKKCEELAGNIKFLTAAGGDTSDLERCKAELRSTKRQCDLLKNLLNDASAENEIMYQAFNEELDGMFNDANLPEDEAWSAMTTDLRKAKEDRNRLTQENAQLTRKLKEIELQRDEWALLLREHGLIP